MHNDSIVMDNFMLSIGLNGKLDYYVSFAWPYLHQSPKVDNAAGRAAIFETECRAFES
jgi:hypothetical protein